MSANDTDTDTDTDTDDDSTDDELHTRDLFGLDDGDDVTLVLDDGSTVDATFNRKTSHHDDTGPHIHDQETAHLTRADGTPLKASLTDGLSGLPDVDPFPYAFPLHEAGDDLPRGGKIPDDMVLGYVRGVRQR